MWTRDLQIYTVQYEFSWRERLVDSNDDFSSWGQPILQTTLIRIVAPSEHYIHAYVKAQHAHDPGAKPRIISWTADKLHAIINPNHP
jgi:hypothetical protein